MNTPKTILFYGMSGAGKGTQAKLLIEKLRKDRATHFIEVGQMLRDYAKKHDTYGAQTVRETINAGGLVPPAVSSHLWSGVLLNEINANDNVVIDGAARSVPEAKLLNDMLSWMKREYTIFILEVDAQTALQRAIARGENRADDTQEAMEKRLEWFKNDTMPAIEYMESQGATVHRIDGSKSIEEVHTDIITKLDL